MKPFFPKRYTPPSGYGLTPYQSEIITRSPWLAIFFEELFCRCYIIYGGSYTPKQVANALINIPKFARKWVPLIETETRKAHWSRGDF